MYTSQDIANRIKSLAKIRGIQLKILFEKANVSWNTMANMKKSFPSVEKIARIADILECSTDYLLGRTDIVEINKGE